MSNSSLLNHSNRQLAFCLVNVIHRFVVFGSLLLYHGVFKHKKLNELNKNVTSNQINATHRQQRSKMFNCKNENILQNGRHLRDLSLFRHFLVFSSLSLTVPHVPITMLKKMEWIKCTFCKNINIYPSSLYITFVLFQWHTWSDYTPFNDLTKRLTSIITKMAFIRRLKPGASVGLWTAEV